MRFASLGSGSGGNATLVAHKNEYLLIDLGFSLRQTQRRLTELGVQPEQIGALLVSHEHGDHIAGAGYFARQFSVPVYMTEGTWQGYSAAGQRGGDFPDLRFFVSGRPFTFGSFVIEPVAMPHDTKEPCQFLVTAAGRKFGILTDLGRISRPVREGYADCDALMLECNYDPGMLESGPYPPHLRQRVASDLGHLSNRQAAQLLSDCDQRRLQQLVLCHISRKNNRPELALREVKKYLTRDFTGKLVCAEQEQSLSWLEIK